MRLSNQQVSEDPKEGLAIGCQLACPALRGWQEFHESCWGSLKRLSPLMLIKAPCHRATESSQKKDSCGRECAPNLFPWKTFSFYNLQEIFTLSPQSVTCLGMLRRQSKKPHNLKSSPSEKWVLSKCPTSFAAVCENVPDTHMAECLFPFSPHVSEALGGESGKSFNGTHMQVIKKKIGEGWKTVMSCS